MSNCIEDSVTFYVKFDFFIMIFLSNYTPMNELIFEEIKIQNDKIIMFEENCIWLIGNIHDDEDRKLCEKRFIELSKLGIRIVRNHKYDETALIHSIRELSEKETNLGCRIIIMHYYDEIANMDKFNEIIKKDCNIISKPLGIEDEYCLSGLVANQVVISSFLRKLNPKDHGYLQWMNLIEYVRTAVFITEQYICYNHGIRDEELETIKAQELAYHLKEQKVIADDIIVRQQYEICSLMMKLGFKYCIADDQKRKELEPLLNQLRTSYYVTQKYMKPNNS